MRTRAGLALAALLSSFAAVASATADASVRPAAACSPRTLVLSAMPIEIAPLLARTTVERTVRVDGRDYVLGRLQGHPVVLTLTGIGPVNARRHTERALSLFRCGARSGIRAVVFSGVAGGDYIGDVVVPTTWTADHGRHFLGVDRRMLAVARRVARHGVGLERTAPAGDPACTCAASPDLVPTVTVTHAPRVEVGGAGDTTDPFSGRALPCAPGGGDVFGCEPCALQGDTPTQAQTFATGVTPFADPSFFTGYSSSTASSGHYVAEDEETAVVDQVATAARLPFLGFRGVSDGGGDPLGLPGFPFQFFLYRQLSADNAATVTSAFLAAWRG